MNRRPPAALQGLADDTLSDITQGRHSELKLIRDIHQGPISRVPGTMAMVLNANARYPWLPPAQRQLVRAAVRDAPNWRFIFDRLTTDAPYVDENGALRFITQPLLSQQVWKWVREGPFPVLAYPQARTDITDPRTPDDNEIIRQSYSNSTSRIETRLLPFIPSINPDDIRQILMQYRIFGALDCDEKASFSVKYLRSTVAVRYLMLEFAAYGQIRADMKEENVPVELRARIEANRSQY